MRFNTSYIVLFQFVLNGAWAGPVIEAIEGDRVVVVVTAHGNRIAEKGSPVEVGERVKTGPRATAKIKFPDGSKLLIGKNTELEVREDEAGTQKNELHAGQVRGLIQKPKGLSPTAPPRFMIRTRTAVMGVRGTDFVFETASESAKVHTLDGTVEVGNSEEQVLAGKGTPVERGETALIGKEGVNSPEKFDREEYYKTLSQNQPGFVSLVNDDPELRSRLGRNGEVTGELHKEKKPVFQFHLTRFRAIPQYIVPDFGGSRVALEASYDPRIELFSFLLIGPHIGYFPTSTAGKSFWVGEFAMTFGFELFRPLLFEFGIGDQSWHTQNFDSGMTLVNVGWKLTDSFIDRIYLGWAHLHGHENTYRDFQGNIIRSGYGKVEEMRVSVGFEF